MHKSALATVLADAFPSPPLSLPPAPAGTDRVAGPE
jgi:hypothetical protein